MPQVFQLSVDQVVATAQQAADLGIVGIILFGIPGYKDKDGSSAWDVQGPVARSIRAVKQTLPDMVIITDVCMCEYTDHGHCGRLVERPDKSIDVDNDSTLPLLVEEALCHARAGADIIAPSDMMDGRVGAIREGLDKEGFEETAILSYAVKYASGFYGPFRDAAESTPLKGDRRGYQMDPANWREAIKEVHLDLSEGADMVMVKPALSYLDIITRVREITNVPVAAYNVSGEYAMVKAAARSSWLDEERVMMEILYSIKRAGADVILTYYAMEAARILSS